MKKEGLYIPCLQLHFSSQQLKQLNIYFLNMESNQDLKHNQLISCIESEIDGLIQYLSSIIGCLDSRFKSEFLIRLEPSDIFRKNNYSYLIHLDSLSTIAMDSDDTYNYVTDFSLEFGEKIPDGFGKIKLENEYSFKRWSDCASKNGYLRRDKIQKKYVELLKRAVSFKLSDNHNYSENIKNLETNIPGKIFDAETLHYILNIPRSERLFYGSSERSKQLNLSSSIIQKYHIEIIESNSLIKLRIGFLSTNVILDEDIDVILILGIGLQGWPASSDYPNRILLTNCDVLLHHQIATTGFFMITTYPQTMEQNKNRKVFWQFFFPAADCMLINNFSEISCVIKTINIVYTVMLNLRRTTCGGHTVGKYLIKTLVWFRVEKLNELKFWTMDYLSFHVISLLDEIAQSLRKEKCRSYFFENYNALTNAFCNSFSAELSDDLKRDADIVETFIQRIYALSSSELIGHQTIGSERRRNTMLAYESKLMKKWNNLLANMNENRRRDNEFLGFISKQLEYTTYLFRAILITKCVVIPIQNSKVNTSYLPVNYSSEILKKFTVISSEDASFIVTVLLNHAKKLFVLTQRNKKLFKGVISADNANLESDSKTKIRYDKTFRSVILCINENMPVIFRNDVQAVKFILKSLYECMTCSKTLRKILKPFLKLFSISTYKNCWYLEEWKNRIQNDELAALRAFSLLVSEYKMELKAGSLDALRKGWDWANDMVKLCLKQQNQLKVFFDPSNKQMSQFSLYFTEEEIERLIKYKLNLYKSNNYISAINKLCDVLKLEEKSDTFYDEEISVQCILRDNSPVTRIISSNRRHGMHPGIGNIIFSLIILGKFTTLQEITEILPEEKRHLALENIHRTIKIKQRNDRLKTKSKVQEEIYRSLQYGCHNLPYYTSNEKLFI